MEKKFDCEYTVKNRFKTKHMKMVAFIDEGYYKVFTAEKGDEFGEEVFSSNKKEEVINFIRGILIRSKEYHIYHVSKV